MFLQHFRVNHLLKIFYDGHADYQHLRIPEWYLLVYYLFMTSLPEYKPLNASSQTVANVL
jgi:hypothetical protein